MNTIQNLIDNGIDMTNAERSHAGKDTNTTGENITLKKFAKSLGFLSRHSDTEWRKWE